MKAKVKGRYEAHKGAASAAFSITSGDLKLTATLTDATFSTSPSLTGLALSLHKPGSFSLIIDVPKKDVGFQFINVVSLMSQEVRLTYTHTHALGVNGRMALAGSTNINAANKVGLGYEFCSEVIKVWYAHSHGDVEKRTVVEPCLDLSKNAWEIAVTRWSEGRDSFRAMYHDGSKDLGIEWRRKSKVNGSFKAAPFLSHFMPSTKSGLREDGGGLVMPLWCDIYLRGDIGSLAMLDDLRRLGTSIYKRWAARLCM